MPPPNSAPRPESPSRFFVCAVDGLQLAALGSELAQVQGWRQPVPPSDRDRSVRRAT